MSSTYLPILIVGSCPQRLQSGAKFIPIKGLALSLWDLKCTTYCRLFDYVGLIPPEL